jgi:hypothetical protein
MSPDEKKKQIPGTRKIRDWRLTAARGVVALLFSAYARNVPRLFYSTFSYSVAWIFRAYALVNGILAIFAAVRHPRDFDRVGAPYPTPVT